MMKQKQEDTHWLDCKRCGMNGREADEDVKSFVCWRCTQKAVGAPIEKKIRNESEPRKPRGWQWKAEYVDNDGNVFYKGIEQPELKGTLKPTPIKQVLIKKSQTFQERLVEQEKQQSKLVKQYKQKKEK